jgi:hypothetical protein
MSVWFFASFALDAAAHLAALGGAELHGGVVPTGKPVGDGTIAPPAPTGIPITGADQAATEVIAQSLPGTPGADFGTVILVIAAVFAAIGFIRGSKREVSALLAVIPAYLLFSSGWTAVANLINQAWRFLNIIFFQLALLGGSEGEVSQQSITASPIMPTTEAPFAQLAAFCLTVVIIYAFTRGQGSPNFIERVIGALISSFTGYVVGVFVIGRLMPQATISVFSPGETTLAWIDRLGPYAGLIFISTVILFGFRSLGPKGFARRY